MVGKALVMIVPSMAEQGPVSDSEKMIVQKCHDFPMRAAVLGLWTNHASSCGGVFWLSAVETGLIVWCSKL